LIARSLFGFEETYRERRDEAEEKKGVNTLWLFTTVNHPHLQFKEGSAVYKEE
jgi:hypothetical protein